MSPNRAPRRVTVADVSEYMDCVIDFMLQAVDTWLEYFKEAYNN
jgi:hypothetical protein